ncbi:GIN domain-containing protein [Solirubrobacter soli]|uniref:GIN domain-containing protein n=1 Tax=Solirubrobacter soli TaxID=363832 RepID=UPI0003FDB730|nr:DUF2807 domain-containing protein [Solirubrobacter soli]
MSTGHTTTHRSRFQRAVIVAGAIVVAILLMLLVDRIFFATSTTSTGTGSGHAATQARSVPPFTTVDLTGANNVVVRVGARQSVVVHADENLLGRVTTSVHAGTLLIDTTPGDLNAKSPMFVVVSVPSLAGLRLDGAGNISASGIANEHLTVAMPGSGVIDATGTTRTLTLTMDGQGTALLRRLVARDANVALAGNGTIMLTATRSLNAKLSGTGAILYGGNPPHVTQSVTGSGTVNAG